MASRGFAKTTTTIKVRRPAGALRLWTLSDRHGEHVEERQEQLVEQRVREAVGPAAEAFFEAEWTAVGWKIGSQVIAQDW